MASCSARSRLGLHHLPPTRAAPNRGDADNSNTYDAQTAGAAVIIRDRRVDRHRRWHLAFHGRPSHYTPRPRESRAGTGSISRGGPAAGERDHSGPRRHECRAEKCARRLARQPAAASGTAAVTAERAMVVEVIPMRSREYDRPASHPLTAAGSVAHEAEDALSAPLCSVVVPLAATRDPAGRGASRHGKVTHHPRAHTHFGNRGPAYIWKPVSRRSAVSRSLSKHPSSICS